MPLHSSLAGALIGVTALLVANPVPGVFESTGEPAVAQPVSTANVAPQGLVAAAPTASVNPAVAAAQAEVERAEALLAKFPPPKLTIREQAEQILAEVPGGAGVDIEWNHPDIGNHLGGVWLHTPEVLMLNESRFEADPDRLASTIKHEIAHTLQGRIIADRASNAGSWNAAYYELGAALRPAFGDSWMERSADCVALELGATWTHYTKDCDSKAAKAATAALLDGRLP